MSYLLGIDVGTSGSKALLCDYRGRVRSTATVEHEEPSSRKPLWSEQDPVQWWAAACQATRAVLRKGRIHRNQVTGIGLSGQMHGSVFLGGSTKPLRPALLWNDQRTAAECVQIEKSAGGRRKLIQMVGNPALTGFTAPKILWVRKNEPRVYEKTRHILLPKDYIRFCMTGERATEVGDASGTLLLDVKNRRYNARLLSLLKIDQELLADCYESHEVTGRLHKVGAASLGLSEGTAVVGGSGDQPAGAIGNGVVRSGVVGATLGTSGVVFAHSDKPVYDSEGRVHTMCAAVENHWCVFGCMLSAGGSFQWFRNMLGQGEIAESCRKKVDPYVLLTQLAEKTAPGCEGLFFLPYLTGERCPYADPNARGGWIGLNWRHDRSALIRALLEGVTFGMADTLQIMQQMKIPIRSVRLSGGGARSKFWRQLQADIYGKTCATINADEGPAYGAALLAGVGTGAWSSVAEACFSAVKETERIRPVPGRIRLYRKQHVQYQRLYRALRDEFAHIAAFKYSQ